MDAAGLSQHPIAVLAIDRWSNITRQGIEFAARLSPEVIALHVEPNEHSELPISRPVQNLPLEGSSPYLSTIPILTLILFVPGRGVAPALKGH